METVGFEIPVNFLGLGGFSYVLEGVAGEEGELEPVAVLGLPDQAALPALGEQHKLFVVILLYPNLAVGLFDVDLYPIAGKEVKFFDGFCFGVVDDEFVGTQKVWRCSCF